MIDQDQALDIARQRSQEKGWAFADPVSVAVRRSWSGKIRRYEIETNSGKLGTKARFVIDAHTGEILSEGYLPR